MQNLVWLFSKKQELIEKKHGHAGSVMLAVVVIFSIFIIIGFALLGLALVRHRYALTQINSKSSEYLAEAGLNEAYAKLAKKVEIATYNASVNLQGASADYFEAHKNMTNDDVDKFMDKAFANGYERRDPIEPGKFAVAKAGFYQELCNELYKPADAFGTGKYTELKGDLTDYTLFAALPTIAKKDDDLAAHRMITVTAISLKFAEGKGEVVTADLFANNRINGENAPSAISDKKIAAIDITFQSTNIAPSVSSDPKIRPVPRTITATLRIKAPEPLYVRKMKSHSPIVDKALIAGDNINVSGKAAGETCKADITGDVYAFGLATTTNGGIVCGNGSGRGELNVTGDIDSAGYIKCLDNSSMALSGDVYCDTLTVPMGVVGGTIDVKDKYGEKPCVVNTLDDVVLDGNSSKISITGYLYAFNDGSLKDYLNKPEHDKRSAVIVNSDDIGISNKSSISIMDISSGIHTKDIQNGYKGYPEGTFLAGSVYVNAVDKTTSPAAFYRTGDSVSLKQNYMVYAIEKTTFNNYEYNDKGEIIKNSSKPTTYSAISENDYKTYENDDFSERFISSVSAIEGSETNIDDFIIKSYFAYSLYDDPSMKDESGKNYLMDTDGIDVNNIIYSIGNYIDKKIYKLRKSNNINFGASSITPAEITSRKLSDYLYRIFMLSDGYYDVPYEKFPWPQSSLVDKETGKPFNIGDIQAALYSLEEHILTKQGSIVSQLLFSFSGISGVVEINDKLEDSMAGVHKIYPIRENDKSNELAVVNNSINTVWLVETEDDRPIADRKDEDIVIVVGNQPVKGLIITKGNLFVAGNVDFKGSMVSDASINLTGEGTIKIAHDAAYVNRKLYDARLRIRSGLKTRAYEAVPGCENLRVLRKDDASVNAGAAEFVFEDFFQDMGSTATTEGAFRMKMPISIAAWHADDKGAI